jgi:ATP-dependent Lhr-like helicase
VEEKLKQGELKAIVATNSLELGIDIGRLDSVVLIQSPRSIASAIQRIGRSGHGVGEISRGVLYPSHGMDFVEAAVIARAIKERDLEPLHPVEAPLDLLAQILVSMALTEEWPLDDLYAFLKTSYPYRNLARSQFDLVVGMLAGGYADSRVPELRPRVTVDRLTNTIASREGMATLVYLEGGTIPDRGYYDLRLQESGAKIGELDEEFVWERRVGETFSLGAQVWQIKEITHNAVQVVPARRPQQIIPFWRAEELDRSFHYSEKIASFLEFCNGDLENEGLIQTLVHGYAMEEPAAEALLSFLQQQKEETGTDLPHRHHLLIEHFHDPRAGSEPQQAILHTLWGNGVNRPLSFALAAAWEKEFGSPLQAFHNNDGISLLLPHGFDVRELFSLVTPENIETLLRLTLESTGFFGARFRENAGRALLLPKTSFRKRMPLWLNRLRSRKLLGAVSRYRDFPILVETWRSCLQDDFDLLTLRRLLAEIQDGEIRIGETRTTVASPFARGLIWQQTNKYLYEDDTPEVRRLSGLGSDLIRELALSPHLRPRLPLVLIWGFERKRQRLAEGYPPDSARELIDWVKERVMIPQEEWIALLDAVRRDHGLEPEVLLPGTAERLVFVAPPGAASPLVAPIELLPEIGRGLGRSRLQLGIAPLLNDPGLAKRVDGWVEQVFSRRPSDGEAAEEVPFRLIGQWLSFYGPMELGRLERTLAPEAGLLEAVLLSLQETGQVVVDQLTENAAAQEVCDAVNLEALLRSLRRSRQPAFQALGLHYLPLFLAHFQGVAEEGRTMDDLRHRLEQLFGVPLPVSSWEEEMLPARMATYSTAWLDSIMQTSDLVWFGCGERRVSFAFPEDLDLFLEPEGADAETELVNRLIPDPHGRYSLPTIASLAGMAPAEAGKRLWRLAWRGRVTNDSFAAVRKGILGRFGAVAVEAHRGHRLPRGSRWQAGERGAGNWHILHRKASPADPLATEEMNRERVRVLLDRYGILFRELLSRELPPLQWARLFRTLRIMELSGEVLSGSFFAGIPGLQFISQEGYRMLTKGLPEETVYWMNAADPASLCGSGLEAIRGELPPRVPGTHLVYHGARLVVVSRRFGTDLTFKVPPEEPRIGEYLSFFQVLVSREFNPRKRISVERINGVAALDSPYRKVLREWGFQDSYRGLELWRRYV